MAHDAHHEHLIKEVEAQFKPILSRSPQAIYIYLDDTHKTCNKKFADMLGYKSPKEWIANQYPVSDVHKKDQKKVISAYMEASRKFKAATLSATLVKRNGKKLNAEVIMVPLSYNNEVFVLHFISKVSK